MANTLVWVDIPAVDLDRAVKFYAAVLGQTVGKMEYPGFSLGLLPGREGEVTGCLFVASEGSAGPGTNGPLVYLNCEGRLSKAETAVTANGGKVEKARHGIPPHGFRVIAHDSEGNRIALHSHKDD